MGDYKPTGICKLYNELDLYFTEKGVRSRFIKYFNTKYSEESSKDLYIAAFANNTAFRWKDIADKELIIVGYEKEKDKWKIYELDKEKLKVKFNGRPDNYRFDIRAGNIDDFAKKVLEQ